MNVEPTPGALKKFRRASWRFQQTVERPEAHKLDNFVSSIIKAQANLATVTITIDNVIFSTDRMSAICPTGAVLTHDTSILAQSVEEAQALLVAAFWDGPDFICIPTPKSFVFYADHDDYITFFANTKSHVNRVVQPLSSQGYRLVNDWQRKL